ncbi:hypothetical protein SARC_07104 [Sphaeroforma arctica JP610]|uniref:tRNA-splicing endonuclease subunit Sen54 N-terminal domain-containing protein n=1 Tax=Sphaeroforma arctica JP610 TaxID=667725 RepID=A0A0L0FUM3_9EUKA|nr:hypothetical protein SARC_07104 [Sphaeroforma arctica JP610]KNC80532.1 hypothetical protein SARC_07104 [Sphaeroforma arctica JP610]|eukprot:XP_014154434.1 hypothetical protein SARC_07104 [Sphaeroforma arctica JP610]
MTLPKRSAKGSEPLQYISSIAKGADLRCDDPDEGEVPLILATEWAARARFVRTKTIKAMSIAVWHEELRMAEVVAASGAFIGPMALHARGMELLTPEEAMYLAEKRELEIFVAESKIPLSLEQARILLLQSVPSQIYKTYGYLKRLGFVVRQHNVDRWREISTADRAKALLDPSAKDQPNDAAHSCGSTDKKPVDMQTSSLDKCKGVPPAVSTESPTLSGIDASEVSSDIIPEETQKEIGITSQPSRPNVSSSAEIKEEGDSQTKTTKARNDKPVLEPFELPLRPCTVFHMDVWIKPSSFKRSRASRPDFVVRCILYNEDSVSRDFLKQTRELCDGIPVRVAAVAEGTVMFFSTLFKGARLEYGSA